MLSVAILYEFKKDEIWSTPWSIYKELERRGYHVERFHLSNEGVEEFFMSPTVFNIALVMDWKGLRFDRLDKAYMPYGTMLIGELADCPQNLSRHLFNVNKYDLLLCPAYDSTQQLIEMGYNTIWWTHFADTVIHNTQGSLISKGSFTVRSTRGTGSSYILDSLSAIMPDKFENKNGLIGEEYGVYLSQGLITVQESRHKEITRRIFEGMACKTLVLTDRLPEKTGIGELFTNGWDYVTYNGLPDLISKINYYLSPEGMADRLDIAERGYMSVNLFHTQVQRVDEIIKQYMLWQKTFRLKH